ncbi:MAG: AAA family ATPase, partial [Elusimicrobiales bacterium]|nr:AAA family ATPase [Elusimicrobiales bacterium]
MILLKNREELVLLPGFVKNEIELERDVQKELAAWKRKRHNTVLQVEGPRQVGKTHEIKKFTYSHYNNVIYINLVRDEYGFEDLLSESGGSFMAEYCEQAGLPPYCDNENTVLVIDEIQESQMVYNSIRDLRERLSCDIIVSGSYLARTVNSKDFFLPAGIAYLRMYPLSFQEFCRARDCEDILEQLHPFGESPSGNYERLERKYQIYRH